MKGFILLVVLIGILVVEAKPQKNNIVETENLKIHYLEFGKGKDTIILLHGLSNNAEIWKKFAPLLSKKYHVIAIDRRGISKSEKTKTGYNLKTFAQDIKDLLDKLKIEKVHLVGHSFGGNIAMTFAAEFPTRLNTLILIEGGFWEKR